MAASMLPRSADAPERVRVLADKIQRSVDRSVAMIDGLLGSSRSPEPEPGSACSVASVLDETLEQLAPDVARVDAAIERCIEEAEVACSRELFTVVRSWSDVPSSRGLRWSVRARPHRRLRRAGPEVARGVSGSGVRHH